MLQSDRRNLSMMMDFYEMTMGYGYFRSQKPCNRGSSSTSSTARIPTTAATPFSRASSRSSIISSTSTSRTRT